MTATLSLACWDYDRTMPILEGRIPIEGYEIAPEIQPTGTTFPLAVDEAPYDITELSLAAYLIQTSRGNSKYIALPIFLSRGFRHAGVYARTDAGIETPKDLEGRVVGVPEYAMTFALWIRGILADQYGVDIKSLKYRTAGLNQAGRVERLTLDLPPEINLQPLPSGENLNDALLAGQLEAILSPAPPRAFADGNPAIKRLIDPPGPAERDYYRSTGIFPVMHVVGVRNELAAANPGLCSAVYDAFLAARRVAMDRVRAVAEGSANRNMSPWYAEAYEDAVALMGRDYWPYGVASNRKDLETICRYAHEQFLTGRLLTPDELFHPEVLEKRGG